MVLNRLDKYSPCRLTEQERSEQSWFDAMDDRRRLFLHLASARAWKQYGPRVPGRTGRWLLGKSNLVAADVRPQRRRELKAQDRTEILNEAFAQHPLSTPRHILL